MTDGSREVNFPCQTFFSWRGERRGAVLGALACLAIGLLWAAEAHAKDRYLLAKGRCKEVAIELSSRVSVYNVRVECIPERGPRTTDHLSLPKDSRYQTKTLPFQVEPLITFRSEQYEITLKDRQITVIQKDLKR